VDGARKKELAVSTDGHYKASRVKTIEQLWEVTSDAYVDRNRAAGPNTGLPFGKPSWPNSVQRVLEVGLQHRAFAVG